MNRRHGTFLAAALFAFLAAAPSEATTLTFDLNCVLGHPQPDDVVCGGGSWGSVTLDDSVGNGDIEVTVDLAGGDGIHKFKELLFNYNGSATGITAGSGETNLLSPDLVGTSPYSGLFDVDTSVANGGVDDPFSIIFYGWDSTTADAVNDSTSGTANVNLTLANFAVLDTLGQTFLSLHIQAIGPNGCNATSTPPCDPGTPGDGSVNSVGSNSILGPPPPGREGEETVPEPGSLILLGTGLAAMAHRLRARRRA